MLRLSKLTDYGVVLLAHLARLECSAGVLPRGARDVAEQVELPAPVVSKVLKELARHGVLASQRGAKGGYTLARPPEQISVAAVITALEGPVAMTECAAAAQLCQHEGSCAVQQPWQVISHVVHDALEQITLADLIDPFFSERLALLQIQPHLRAGDEAASATGASEGDQ